MQLSNMISILGGRRIIRGRVDTRMDLVNLAQSGVPKESLVRLAAYLRLSLGEISALLPVTERTVQRYAASKRFKRGVSEHILQIAEVAARGTEVFGEQERFLAWVSRPSTALGGRTPLELLSSRFGAEMVLDELGRIEHGVIA